MMNTVSELSAESLGYLNYLHRVLTQPAGRWEGFYRPQSPNMNFALRYQLAFATYALAALAQHTPAYRGPYREAMQAAIERMLDGPAWNYWRVPETAAAQVGNLASSGHVAVLVSPHQRGVAGPPSDPVARDNLQYSGHLSTMLGLYEKVTGDTRYDSPFSLHDEQSGATYTYTHSRVAERIYSQMQANGFGGVCCEQGMAYVPCNNYAMASNTLHDALHGTHYAALNSKWLKTVRGKMVLHGPAVRGVFGTSYVKDIHMATPVAFNFTDAWGLAFLVPFDRPLVRKLYPKFKKKVVQAGPEGSYVGSSTMSERMEISDVPVNTGFGLILARAAGDTAAAEEMVRYAATAFGLGWSGSEYFLKGAPRNLHATSLFALAACIEPGGDNFVRLFREGGRSAPAMWLQQVESAASQAGVFRAEYSDQDRVLRLGLRQVGLPAEQTSDSVTTLTVGGAGASSIVEVGGTRLPQESTELDGQGNLRFKVLLPPNKDVPITVSAS